MRSEKELWELVLTEQDIFDYGLCHWVRYMYWKQLISLEERKLLLSSLEENLPEKREDEYCWKPCEIQPRIDWIKNRIKQLEHDEAANT